jgi:hypothetical protein
MNISYRLEPSQCSEGAWPPNICRAARPADELIEMTRREVFAGLLAITTASAPLPPANRPQGWRRGIRVSPHASRELHASA